MYGNWGCIGKNCQDTTVMCKFPVVYIKIPQNNDAQDFKDLKIKKVDFFIVSTL